MGPNRVVSLNPSCYCFSSFFLLCLMSKHRFLLGPWLDQEKFGLKGQGTDFLVQAKIFTIRSFS